MTQRRVLAETMADHVVLLDGGLSTALEARGHVLDDPLWTARCLRDDPAEVAAAHADFVAVGAEVVITASYQATEPDLLVASVAAARDGAPGAWVAASVGPYGAILHDGSEYRGRYGLSVDELAAFHRPRIEVLVGAAPDALAVETIPDLDEARALARVLSEVDGVPETWVAFSCGPDGRLHSSHDVAEAAALVAAVPAVVAVGVNCTAPLDVGPALRRIRSVTDLPLVAYPNRGGTWDAASGEWHDDGDGVSAALVAEWCDLGVRLVGGCCGFGPAALAELATLVRPVP